MIAEGAIHTVQKSGSLAPRQKLAHAAERLDDIFRRIGVGQPHITLAEDAEIRPADDGDAGFIQQRGGERFCLPARAL